MSDQNTIDALRGSTVYASDGDKIGRVGEVYLDDQTGEPTFVTVNTGLFGTKETFIPLEKAQINGEDITVPFEKSFVKDAPNIADDDSLSPEEEQRIYEYYSVSGTGAGHGTDAGRTQHGEHVEHGTAAGLGHQAGRDRADLQGEPRAEDRERTAEAERTRAEQAGTAGTAGEQDVVAHEEHLRTGDQAERRETGRVRLRKHVVTDTETVDVPVRREEVHVQRESIDPNSAEARAGAEEAFTADGEETVVTTYEERPVVQKETVATERVSLDKETTESTERVQGEVRKEEIEVDEDGRTTR